MAQVEFFSTSEDEEKLFANVAKDKFIKCSVVIEGSLTDWKPLTELEIPEFNSNLEILFWNTSLGNLKWLRQEPKIDFSRNSKLVNSVFTRENWMRRKEQNSFDKMLDGENSPILIYRRGEKIGDLILPSLILSSQSSLDFLGHDFKKWFNRISSWIKRNGEMVHHWKDQNTEIRNDDGFLNTIYALNYAFKELKLRNNKYAISINEKAKLSE